MGHTGYGMGAAAGDVDNDGFVDLYVTNYGPDCLYHNEAGRSFADVTRGAGLSGEGWSSSAGFLDYDADGFLDLFVARYLDYDPAVTAVDDGGLPEYPSPSSFDGLPDRLYRNQGDGTFADVGARAGLESLAGRGLGVVFTDLDDDGRVDIYVANDGDPNFAWINTGSGRFEERAQVLGLAVNAYGQPEAGMGIALGDSDLDGGLDLLVTHLVQESNTLYRRRSPGVFEDATAGSGLGAASVDYTAFGTAFADLDQDGDLDLLVANGRVYRALPHPGAGVSAHWRGLCRAQPALPQRRARGRFLDAGPRGAAFTTPVEVSRGSRRGRPGRRRGPRRGGRQRQRHRPGLPQRFPRGRRLAACPRRRAGAAARRLRRGGQRDDLGGDDDAAGDRRGGLSLQQRSPFPLRSRRGCRSREHPGAVAGRRRGALPRRPGEPVGGGPQGRGNPGAVKRTLAGLRRVCLPAVLSSPGLLVACGPGADPPEIDISGLPPRLVERIQERREAVVANPGSAEAWGALGMVLDVHDLRATAAHCYERAQGLDGDDFRWPYLLGVLKLTSHQGEALELLSRAARTRDDYPPLWVYLGSGHLLGERFEEAAGAFRRALDLDPEFYRARLGLARVALARDQPRRARETAGDSPRPRRLRGGGALAARGSQPAPGRPGGGAHPPAAGPAPAPAGARLRLPAGSPSAAGGPDPGPDPGAHRSPDPAGAPRRGRSRSGARCSGRSPTRPRSSPGWAAPTPSPAGWRRRSPPTGPPWSSTPLTVTHRCCSATPCCSSASSAWPGAAYEHALELDPSHARTRFKLGSILVLIGAEEEGLQHLRKARGALGRDLEAQLLFADAVTRLGRHREAVDTYRQALESFPGEARLQRRLAWLLATSPDEGVRDGAEALVLARRAAQGPGDPRTLETLAAAFAENGDFPEAVGRRHPGQGAAAEGGGIRPRRGSWRSAWGSTGTGGPTGRRRGESRGSAPRQQQVGGLPVEGRRRPVSGRGA